MLRRRQARRRRTPSPVRSCGANRWLISNMSSSTSRTRLPEGLAGPAFSSSTRSISFQAAMTSTSESRCADQWVAPARRASFSTSSKGTTPASIRWARRAGSEMPDSSSAAWYCQRLNGEPSGRRNTTDFRKGCINVPSAPWPESPATAATRVSMPCSSGMGNRPSQYRSTSPPMTEAPAIRPRSPAMRTSASVSQVATSRSLEFDFKAPIASVATGRQSAGRPSSPPSVSACRSASRAPARASRRRK